MEIVKLNIVFYRSFNNIFEDDDDDCNIHEIADEKDYLAENSPFGNQDNRKSNDGRSACSPNTSTSITVSGKVETRIKILYDKRRRSLDRIEKIRAEERRALKQLCTFKPEISQYASKNNINSTFKSPVIFKKAFIFNSQDINQKKL